MKKRIFTRYGRELIEANKEYFKEKLNDPWQILDWNYYSNALSLFHELLALDKKNKKRGVVR